MKPHPKKRAAPPPIDDLSDCIALADIFRQQLGYTWGELQYLDPQARHPHDLDRPGYVALIAELSAMVGPDWVQPAPQPPQAPQVKQLTLGGLA